MKIKKGDTVKVIAGKDKGKTGEILEINRKLNKVKIKTAYMSLCSYEYNLFSNTLCLWSSFLK